MSSYHSLAHPQEKTGSGKIENIFLTRVVKIYARSSHQLKDVLRKIVPGFDSRFIVNATLIACGVIAGTLEFATHMAVDHMNTPPAYHALIDAAMVALITIALMGVCIASAKARRHAVLDQVRTASELNHHLRNALQVITQSRYLPEEKQAEAVFSSIDRIDETLKRLTPQ
jgi:hypothetical protein